MELLYSLLLLIITEVLLRFYFFIKHGNMPLKIEWQKNNKFSIYKNSLFGSYEKKPNIKKGIYVSNNMGFSNEKDVFKQKDKNTVRIFVLGGSTAEQSYSENGLKHKSWPDLLEDKLVKKFPKMNFEIINSSCAGYTIIDNCIDLLTKCIFFKPDFVMLYASINDAYLQPHGSFKEDYSHIRKIPIFPKYNFYNYIPYFKYSYTSYYFKNLILFLITKVVKKRKSLLHYISKDDRQYKANYENLIYIQAVFKSYLKSFDGICSKNMITPIYMPWQFNSKLVSNPFGYANISNWDKQSFVNLLKSNNQRIFEVSKENSDSIFLNLPQMEESCFNFKSKNDWSHFTATGLGKISENIFNELIKNENFLKKITKK